MIDLDFIRGLIEAVDDSGIDSLEIARGGTKIRINKTPPPAPVAAAAAAPAVAHAAAPAPAPAAAAPSAGAVEAAAPAPPVSSLVEIKSPMVGTFYRSPAPEAPPYVELGSRIARGQTLCILEAMKLMNELPAEISGVIREVCVENGEPVEFGQVLFRVDPGE
ncbi:MAG TPA: acetyl-CoA carboxylase biotin carboxyl carrier protein [Longimicrobium sp.]|nr:acetyl-CoA carboxylase biotin carboxyl carrier protein [Longimicrobium sp.]